MLSGLLGSYLPFAKTSAEAKASGDPRPALAERYGSFAEYKRRLTTHGGSVAGQRVPQRRRIEAARIGGR